MYINLGKSFNFIVKIINKSVDSEWQWEKYNIFFKSILNKLSEGGKFEYKMMKNL